MFIPRRSYFYKLQNFMYLPLTSWSWIVPLSGGLVESIPQPVRAVLAAKARLTLFQGGVYNVMCTGNRCANWFQELIQNSIHCLCCYFFL